MLTVCTFKWRPAAGQVAKFCSAHVNVLRSMVARCYPHPHRFVCITDDPAGLSPDVEVAALWDDHGGLANPHGAAYPSCYRRLKLFSPEIGQLLGERFVMLDLDCVLTGDVSALWNRTEDIVLTRGFNPTTHYNGSMMLMGAGARPEVWGRFDPATSPAEALAAKQFGSDQGWISYCLGPGEAKWSEADGVYSFAYSRPPVGARLPREAKIVFFNGKRWNPWDTMPQRMRWVRESWR